jgi:O-antigen ligase
LAVVGALLALWPYAPAYRADAVREWRWTLLEPCLFLGLLVVAGTRTPAARRVLAWCFVAGATVAAFHALSNLALGGGVDVEGVRRIAGPYPHPDALALYVLRGAVFAAAWAAGERVARWLAGSCAVVCLVALAASYSRGAYAAAALALLVVVWSVAPRLRWPALIAVAVAVVAAVAFAGQRMLSLFHGGSGSLRLDIWRAALTMIRDRPVRGYGPDQFLYVYAPRYIAPTAWGERFTSHPHNVVLDFWLTLGIIGAAVALWGAAWIVIRVVATFGKPSADDALQFAAVAALLAALAHGLVDNAYFLHDLAMSAWLLIWLACPVAWQGEALAKGTPSVEGARGWRGRIHRLPSV